VIGMCNWLPRWYRATAGSIDAISDVFSAWQIWSAVGRVARVISTESSR
jgi:hypothetical protein